MAEYKIFIPKEGTLEDRLINSSKFWMYLAERSGHAGEMAFSMYCMYLYLACRIIEEASGYLQSKEIMFMLLDHKTYFWKSELINH